MLCLYCEGTEHSPRPSGLLSRRAGAFILKCCTVCGADLWTACEDCAGEGRKLHIIGQCTHCGQSIIYWLRCKSCQGAGKIYRPEHVCHPQPGPKVTRIPADRYTRLGPTQSV